MSLNDITKGLFFTPEEIASRLKLSVATVYKLISQSELPYFRIGKLYRIPAQAFESYIMEGGNLARFMGPAPKIPLAARHFVELVDNSSVRIKKQIAAITLFGSYARGDQSEYSDIDLLVLLTSANTAIERQISSFSSKAMAAGNFEEFLSPIRMSLAHWKILVENKSPLYKEIRKEGVVLWPKDLGSLKDIENGQRKN